MPEGRSRGAHGRGHVARHRVPAHLLGARRHPGRARGADPGGRRRRAARVPGVVLRLRAARRDRRARSRVPPRPPRRSSRATTRGACRCTSTSTPWPPSTTPGRASTCAWSWGCTGSGPPASASRSSRASAATRTGSRRRSPPTAPWACASRWTTSASSAPISTAWRRSAPDFVKIDRLLLGRAVGRGRREEAPAVAGAPAPRGGHAGDRRGDRGRRRGALRHRGGRRLPAGVLLRIAPPHAGRRPAVVPADGRAQARGRAAATGASPPAAAPT